MEIALILLAVAGAVIYLAKRFRRSLSGSCGCSCADCPGAKTPSPCLGCAELSKLQKQQKQQAPENTSQSPNQTCGKACGQECDHSCSAHAGAEHNPRRS